REAADVLEDLLALEPALGLGRRRARATLGEALLAASRSAAAPGGVADGVREEGAPPGAEAPGGIEVRGAAQQRHEGLGRRVLGRGRVAERPQREPVGGLEAA